MSANMATFCMQAMYHASVSQCSDHVGKDDGAVALPISVPEQISSAIQGSVFGNLLSSAGIKYAFSNTLPSSCIQQQMSCGSLGSAAVASSCLATQPTSSLGLCCIICSCATRSYQKAHGITRASACAAALSLQRNVAACHPASGYQTHACWAMSQSDDLQDWQWRDSGRAISWASAKSCVLVPPAHRWPAHWCRPGVAATNCNRQKNQL